MASRARLEACRQLLKIEIEGSFIGLASGQVKREAQMDREEDNADAASRSRSLSRNEERAVKSLVAGITRWRRNLDGVISRLSGRSTSSYEIDILTVLRMGVFELTFKDSPSHIVSDFVDVSKQLCKDRGVANLVNWTLREAVRQKESNTLPSFENVPQDLSGRDLIRALGLKYSFPNWMVSRFVSHLGRAEAEAFMVASNTVPFYNIRTNKERSMTPSKLVDRIVNTLEGQAEISTLLPDDFVVIQSGLQAVLASDLMDSGSIFVQDVSCGLVVHLLDPQPGESILDGCAAPGSKSIFSAQRMKGLGTIKALDISEVKLRALQSAAERAGISHMIDSQTMRLQDYRGSHDLTYDRVLVDGPCSGSGVLSKRADLRWRRSEKQIQELISLQDDLLEAASQLVKKGGGVLVYSTCSIDKEENEDRVHKFLSKHGGDWEIDSQAARDLLPSEVVTDEGFMRTMPHAHKGCDGAFACRLRRR